MEHHDKGIEMDGEKVINNFCNFSAGKFACQLTIMQHNAAIGNKFVNHVLKTRDFKLWTQSQMFKDIVWQFVLGHIYIYI